MVEGVTTISYI